MASPKSGGKHGRADALAEQFGISRTFVQMARALVLDYPVAAGGR